MFSVDIFKYYRGQYISVGTEKMLDKAEAIKHFIEELNI